MPKVDKAERREKQQRKARHGMVVTNRSIKSVLLPLIGKKAQPKKKES